MSYKEFVEKYVGRIGRMDNMDFSYCFNIYPFGFKGNNRPDNLMLKEVHEDFALFENEGLWSAVPLPMLTIKFGSS
jgi:hypothetical protein